MRGSSVPSRVARALQDMIAERRLKPGDALPSQRELTTLLNASRPSVREGISMLETLGLIRVEQRKGLFVAASSGRTPLDFWTFEKGYDLREVYQFRASFEPAALFLAFAELRRSGLERLRAHAEALHTAAREGNAVAAAEQDTLFHDIIFDFCRNRLYQDMRRSLAKVMQDSQWVPMVIIDRVSDTAREHSAIVNAIEAGDQVAACKALEAHILAAARRCNLDLSLQTLPFQALA
ncbi:FadR/GntR family transcriptional regulator [Roseibium algae]|uniref:FCD domain-containing protein n=1 Tax=Roseibium algae TaxID=3123038 RepID=A0ABU8TI58_9HYPH